MEGITHSGLATSDGGLPDQRGSVGGIRREEPGEGLGRGGNQERESDEGFAERRTAERGSADSGFAERGVEDEGSGREASVGEVRRGMVGAGFSGHLERASQSVPPHMLLTEPSIAALSRGAFGVNQPSLTLAHSLPNPNNPFLDPALLSLNLPDQTRFQTQAQTGFDGPWLPPPTSTTVGDLNRTPDPALTRVIPLLSPPLDQPKDRVQLPLWLSSRLGPIRTNGTAFSHRGWQSFDEVSLEAPQRMQEGLDASNQRRFSSPVGGADVSRGLPAGTAHVSRDLALGHADVSRDLPAGIVYARTSLSSGPSSGAPLEATDSIKFDQRGSAGGAVLSERDSSTLRRSSGGPEEDAPTAEEANEEGTRRVSQRGKFKFPKRLTSWLSLPYRPLDRRRLLSTVKTVILALWAVAIMGVVPFVNTITNAWFLATLYQPRVLECIDFVEKSPGADPSEFPIINGALLQALSWICVILGLIDIGDLLTRLALHLRRQGVPLWRVKPLVWATIKWLMREDERSTHLQGYTHARCREFLFSTGADTIEVFVTASFLFWTGSGYPLATFSLFISLAAIYLTWSFEIAWHIWYLGRRFSPIWPHPTVGSPEDSAAELLDSEPKKEKRWFGERRDSGRVAAESPDDSTERRGDVSEVERRSTEYSQSRRASANRKSETSLANALDEFEAERVEEEVETGVGSFEGQMVNETRVRAGLEGLVKRPVEQLEGRGRRRGLFTTASMPLPELETGFGSANDFGNRHIRGRWETDRGSKGAHVASKLRHRRTRSLEEVDVEQGLIRTLSDVAIRVSADRLSGISDETTPKGRRQTGGMEGAPLTEVRALVNGDRREETENISGGDSGACAGRGAAPRKKKVVGRGERYLFRSIRGVILLAMITAVLVALWLADFGPGVLYGVGITYLTRISTQVRVRCEPSDAPGTFVEYLVPFSGSRVLDLNGVFFYYTAASNAYIFDSSDDELNSITEHDFVVGAVSDPVVAYDWSGSANRTSAGGIKIRFATVLRGVAMLVTTSDAWARRVSVNVTDGEPASPGFSSKFLIDPVKLKRYHPLNQRFVFNYDLSTWQTQIVDVALFGVPVFCRSPYSNATVSPLGRLLGLEASVSMAGISCYNPGNATFQMPKQPVQPPKTNPFY